jgi:hypothetical protein
VDRRLALGALWAAFAVLSVAVGFAAAGLVGDPFTDGVAAGPPAAGQATRVPTTDGSSAPDPTAPDPTGTATTPAPSGSPRPSSSREPDPSAPAGPVTRTLQTRGGTVSATCRGGTVRLSVSPAVGWTVDDLDPPGRESRVRFEPTGDRDGRVEVEARCAGGRPRFELDDDADED